MKERITAHPFVKWVGGKTQLLPELRKHYPFKTNKITTYIEPFVGGGAVLFDVLSTYDIETAIISDTNTALINTYYQIKNNIDKVIEALSDLSDKWNQAKTKQEQSYLYYSQRTIFNNALQHIIGMDSQIAATFIFLNKTCFNGLYRINNKGLFNASLGDNKSVTVCDKDNLYNCHKLLQNVTIYNKSYEFLNKLTVNYSESFIFVDPPYLPLSKQSGSKVYIENLWDRKNHAELAHFLSTTRMRGGGAYYHYPSQPAMYGRI